MVLERGPSMQVRSFSVLIAIILAASFAFANLTTAGPAISTGSWTQQFLESGVGPFNNIVFIITTPGITWGDSGNPTGLNSFIPSDGSDWGSTRTNPQTAWGFDNWSGVGYPTSLYFNATFSSDQSVPFNSIFYAYDDMKLVDHAKVDWTGSNWNISAITPEPASLVLLATGLLGLGTRRKLN